MRPADLLAPRKGDLAGVMLQKRGPPGQNDSRSFAPLDQGHENRRGPQACRRPRQAGIEIKVRRVPRRIAQGLGNGIKAEAVLLHAALDGRRRSIRQEPSGRECHYGDDCWPERLDKGSDFFQTPPAARKPAE